MWFRRRRRRQPLPPVLLPSLDRLGELIERVVALLDQVSLAPVPEQAAKPRLEEELVLEQHKPESVADGWVAFVPSPDGYGLVQLDGPPPGRGTAVELDGGTFLVLRLGPSPLPGDRRRCAYLERQEPPLAERTFDR
jgi:hypothetical protein